MVIVVVIVAVVVVAEWNPDLDHHGTKTASEFLQLVG